MQCISTHTPLAGRDRGLDVVVTGDSISTHTPLAGRDNGRIPMRQHQIHFYSHAPRGARLFIQYVFNDVLSFLLTRPSRGATYG